MKTKTKEVVINVCFGGFGLSHKAVMMYAKLKGIKLYFKLGIPTHYYTVPIEQYKEYSDKWDKNDKDWYFNVYDIPRDDKDLVKVIRTLKKEANDECADLKIVKIPTGVEYEIDEYDGVESIEEKHQSWS